MTAAAPAQKAPGIPKVLAGFPIVAVYEPAPDKFTWTAATGIQTLQVWRYTCPMGTEALLNFVCGTAPLSSATNINEVGPISTRLYVEAFVVPSSTPKGSAVALSNDELAALSRPIPLSQSQGGKLLVPYAGGYFNLVRNLFVPENQTLVVRMTGEHASPIAGLTLWGYLSGQSWLKAVGLTQLDKIGLLFRPATP